MRRLDQTASGVRSAPTAPIRVARRAKAATAVERDQHRALRRAHRVGTDDGVGLAAFEPRKDEVAVLRYGRYDADAAAESRGGAALGRRGVGVLGEAARRRTGDARWVT